MNKKENEWMDEQNLKKILIKTFGIENVKCNKVLKPTSYRPDFIINNKIIVEFDGPRHYTCAITCANDIKKDKIYKNLGYKVVRVPYFIQFEEYAVDVLFGEELKNKIIKHTPKYLQEYPHGFIEKNVILPASFCELGIKRYKEQLEQFYVIDKFMEHFFNTLFYKVLDNRSLLKVFQLSEEYDMLHYYIVNSPQAFDLNLLDCYKDLIKELEHYKNWRKK